MYTVDGRPKYMYMVLGGYLRILGAYTPPPMFNPVSPYPHLLHTLYLFVADVANPDLFSCSFRTWISLDIARFYQE